jgi:hypothetical protein
MAWPKYQLVTFALDGPFEALAAKSHYVRDLAEVGVPRDCLVGYSADGALSLVPRHTRIVPGTTPEATCPGGPLVVFGSVSQLVRLAVDPSTGEVLEYCESPEIVARRTNSSLECFRRTVEAVTAPGSRPPVLGTAG